MGSRHLPTLVALLAAAGAVAPAAGDDCRFGDRMIVHIAEGASLAAFIAAFEKNNPGVTLTERERIPSRSIYLLTVGRPEGYTEEDTDYLEYVLDEDYQEFLHNACAGAGDGNGDGDEWCPSGDFLYENEAPEGKTGSTYIDGLARDTFEGQFALGLMGVPEARLTSTGLGTVVAVLDTGIDAAHPRLEGRVVPGGFDFVDDDADPDDLGEGADNDGDGLIDEMTGHGTFVSGLIVLVAPDTRILPVRVLDTEGYGDEWTVVKGLYFAIDRGVEVINCSLASTFDTVAVKEAIAEAASLGIPVIAAVGHGEDSENPNQFPAFTEEVFITDPPTEIIGAFGIAATDRDDVKADFSNYGDGVFLSAPGDGTSDNDKFEEDRAIISILPGGGYGAWKGTSFATAFVSGAAALLRSQHPDRSSDTDEAWLAEVETYQKIEGILILTATNIDEQNHGFEDELGAGRLDVASAVAEGPPAPAVLGDLNNDGSVNFADLLSVLADWRRTHSSADLDGSGQVGFTDLLIILSNWG